MNSRRISPRNALGSGDSLKLASEPATLTTKCASLSRRRQGLQALKRSLEPECMQNSVDPKLRMTTSGKKRPALQELNLNSGANPFEETRPSTGKLFGPPPSPGSSLTFQQMSELSVTGPFELLAQIIQDQSLWNENVSSSGGKLELENQGGLGMKPVWTLTARTQEPSSGVATKLKNMLSLMSFEAVSTYPISYGGWIGIRSEWRLKEVQYPSQPVQFGSHLILDPQTGILL